MHKRRALLSSLVSLLCLATPAAAAGPRPDRHYDAGVAAFQRGSYAKAEIELKASLAAAPTSKAALYLGNTYLKLGQLEAAREALAEALRLEPSSPKAQAIQDLIDNIDARTGVKVRVMTTPPGATVYLDSRAGVPRGKTPVEFTAPLGRHQVLAVLEGYETATQDQEIAHGAPIKIELTMRAPGCDLSLSAEVPGTLAAVDDAPSAPVPATVRVGKGTHRVVFSAPNHERKELPADCDASGPIALAASLTATGVVTIPSAREAGAVVTVDGRVVDMAPADAAAGLGLPVGHHVITVTTPGKPPWTTTVDVDTGGKFVLAPPDPETRGLYAGLDGAGNFALRDWHLGSNSYVSRDGTRGTHPGSSGMAGLRVGYRILPRLAAEGELSWVGLPNQQDSSSQGLSYDANLLFDILKRSWTPTVEGGVGAYQVVTGGLGSDLSFRGHVGVGLRGRFADWLFLRVDVRDVISRGFDSYGSNNVEAMAGLEVMLWRRTPQASAALVGQAVTGRSL